ncbi:MAG: hypothetical protein R6T85_08475 [Egibacteraceae bacterium]
MRTPHRSATSIVLDIDEDHGCGDLPETACVEVEGNSARLVGALTLQKIGDVVVDAKTVLPWLLAAVGAPAGLTGLLVPIRESGALLPQASLVPRVRRIAVRKWVWVAGALGQAAAAGAIALAAAATDGAVAGGLIVAALAVFALARSLSSISSKDVLGRTVPKGTRGRVNGAATVGSGAVAITVGLAIRAFGGSDADPLALAALVGSAAVAWVLGALVFARVVEPAGVDTATTVEGGWLRHSLRLLGQDRPFRWFVATRTLLLVSALSPPFVITLATEAVGAGLAGLGPFVAASGLAALLGGRGWGRLADRSSRLTMMAGAAGGATVVVVLLIALRVPGLAASSVPYVVAYLLLAFAHTGSRLGRKTYVVDLGEGNARTDYVAVSNTAMGLLLLATGAVTAGLAMLGVEVALVFLAALGFAGVVSARRLPEVSDASS